MAPPPNKLSLHAKQFDGKTKERQCCARFTTVIAVYGRTELPSLLRAHNHIGGATAVPLHHKKCLLCSVLIYIVLVSTTRRYGRILAKLHTASSFHARRVTANLLFYFILFVVRREKTRVFARLTSNTFTKWCHRPYITQPHTFTVISGTNYTCHRHLTGEVPL